MHTLKLNTITHLLLVVGSLLESLNPQMQRLKKSSDLVSWELSHQRWCLCNN